MNLLSYFYQTKDSPIRSPSPFEKKEQLISCDYKDVIQSIHFEYVSKPVSRIISFTNLNDIDLDDEIEKVKNEVKNEKEEKNEIVNAEIGVKAEIVKNEKEEKNEIVKAEIGVKAEIEEKNDKVKDNKVTMEEIDFNIDMDDLLKIRDNEVSLYIIHLIETFLD